MPDSSSRLRKESRHSAGRSVRGRTTGVRIVTRSAFSVFLITACVALGVLSVPQMRKLRALKEELARAKALEAHVEREKDQKRRDLHAIRNDPAYLELVARDRLNLYREGERVYRIERK